MEKSNPDERRYDVVVYGATGDTGSACVRLLYHFADKFSVKRWAMCCRNLQKLDNNVLGPLLQASPTGFKWTGEPMQADSDNLESLVSMCKETKVVIACAGPYACFGENVIAACIQAKTNYVDVTGETDWVNDMRRFYGQAARDAGVSIVSFGGYDSVPSDISTWMLVDALRARNDPPTVVETYVTTEAVGGGAMPTGTIKTVLRMVNKFRYRYSFGLLGEASRKADAKVKELKNASTVNNLLRRDIVERAKRDIANNNAKFKSKILTGGDAIENSVHIMGRINTPVVHETAVMEGFDDFEYFERSIKGGRKAWELHKGGMKQPPNAGDIGSSIGYITMLKAIPMAFTPWFDSWVLSQVKELNSVGSTNSGGLNLVQRLMNEGKMTGYCSMTGFALSKSGKLFARSTFETNWEAGIGTTMACACAVANVLANSGNTRSGFGTPVIACGGNELKDALKDAGINIGCIVNSIEVGSIESKL